MFLTRKIGSLVRGKATPLQVMLAATFGGMLGFVPGFFLPGDLGGGFAQAPGLILVLLSLVLVLNANLAMFGLVTLVAKLLSLVLLPVTYATGTFLIDAMPGVFRGLVNGRVTAWFGLEHYATAGGVVLGLGFGVASGLLVNKLVRTVRTRMAAVEEGSATYQKFAQKGWVKALSWIFLGKGKGKLSWRELAESPKKGLPVRITGVLVAGVMVGSVCVFQQWFSTPILTQNVRAALEAMNGATVDLESATLDLGSGSLRIQGLAIADSKQLGQNLLTAGELVATVDTGKLLARRFVIDELRATSAFAGTPRATPGVLLPTEPQPPEPPPATGTKSIDDWLKDYESWKQRFEQARGWIDVVSGGDDEPLPEPTPEVIEQQRQQQEVQGLAKVVATHLRDREPSVLIRKVRIEGITWTRGDRTEKIDLMADNLSSSPKLVAATPTVAIAEQSDAYRFALTGRSAERRAIGFDFAVNRIPVDTVFGSVKLQGSAPVRGGTMDLGARGTFSRPKGQAMTMDLPLQVAMKGATFVLPGATETLVETLVLPVGIRGGVSNPSVSLDDAALRDALLAAGKQELANYVQANAGKLLGGLPKDLQGIVDPTKAPAQIVDDAKVKASAEAKRIADEAARKAEEEAKQKLQEGAKKLLPRSLNPDRRGGGK